VTDDQTQIHMYGNANATWRATSKREQMHLVSVPAVLPDDEIVKTDKPVAMTMGTTRLNGVGMLANNATRSCSCSAMCAATTSRPKKR
jgi:lipopolysaccharide export system protein LptC